MISSVEGLAVQGVLLALLGLDQAGRRVERDAPVVADDPPAAVRVGQAGQDVRAPALPDVGGVGVEDPFVVGLAVFAERLDDVRVRA
jgi:hypothetical protein